MFDIITYALAKNSAKKYTDAAIASIAKGFDYKGSKPTVADLPTTGNKKGDCWTVTADGSEWIWDSTQWVELGRSIFFDEKTIVKGTDNKYQTAIGGWKETTPEQTTSLFIDTKGTGLPTFVGPGSTEQYEVGWDYSTTITSLVGSATTAIVNAKFTVLGTTFNDKITLTKQTSIPASWESSDIAIGGTNYKLKVYDQYVGENKGGVSVISSDTGADLSESRMELFALVTGAGSTVYHPIDSHFVDVDETSVILDANSKVAVNPDLTLNSLTAADNGIKLYKSTKGQKQPTVRIDGALVMNSSQLEENIAEKGTALGLNCIVQNQAAFASGVGTAARGTASHAINKDTTAANQFSFASGVNTVAGANMSFVAGNSTVAKNANEAVFGVMNEVDTESTDPRLLVVGNGYEADKGLFTADELVGKYYDSGDKTANRYVLITDENKQAVKNNSSITKVQIRQNAFSVKKSGDTYLAGDVYTGANSSKLSSVSVSASGTATDEVQYITVDGVEKKLAGGGGATNAVLYTEQTLTEAQKIQALKNLDGVRIVSLTDGTETLAQLATRINTINTAGEHVFFDTSSLNYSLYLCTLSIEYDGSTPKSYRLNDLVSGSLSLGAYDASKTLSTILSEAVNAYHSLIVTCNSGDTPAQTVTGVTITLYKGESATGTPYMTKTYNGQPLTFVLPDGFPYYITASTYTGHFNPNPLTGILLSDTSGTITYETVATVTTFTGIQAALNDDVPASAFYGKNDIAFTHTTEGELIWDVVDYDETIGEVTLLMHSPFNANMMFDNSEALYYASSQLAAGNYSFKNGSTSYYFTLVNDVPQGGQIRATTSAFQVYSTPEATVLSESGTVSTTVIEGATDIGTCGTNLNHMDRVNYGNNNYYYSNFRRWLISNAAANAWYQHSHKYDRPPSYANKPGFLAGVPADVLAVVADTVVKCSTNNSWEDPEGLYPKANPYTVTDKFFLPSEMEIFGSYGGIQDGSTQFRYYNEHSTAADRIKYTKGTSSARNWWLRSTRWNNTYSERGVYAGGSVDYHASYDTTIGAAVACKIRKSV